MKYYVTDCITGTMEEDGKFESLEEAKAQRARLDKEAMKEGHEEGFWIIVGEDGKEVDWR